MVALHQTSKDTAPAAGEPTDRAARAGSGCALGAPPPREVVLSFDLEEFYGADGLPAGSATALPELLHPLLALLAQAGVRATFFVVGETARRHPALIARIAAEGHELGCHGDRHRPLTELDRDAFARDLAGNIEAITRPGLPAPRGFRAPVLSLGRDQAWCHGLMRAAGIDFSSSVLPARSSRWGGWPGFGEAPRLCDGVVEIPVTLERWGPFSIPCFSGVYFRLLPARMAEGLIARAAQRRPVVGYLHPYDFDARQSWTWHEHFRGKPLLNQLLFVRRATMAARLARLLDGGWSFLTVGEYASRLRAGGLHPTEAIR